MWRTKVLFRFGDIFTSFGLRQTAQRGWWTGLSFFLLGES
jgi:hypothetical protein